MYDERGISHIFYRILFLEECIFLLATCLRKYPYLSKILRRAKLVLLCGKILLKNIVKENSYYLQVFFFQYMLIFNVFFFNVLI